MEINNFIIFIIIILLSIVLYKCAKIYNFREMEKFFDKSWLQTVIFKRNI